jgi:hypothetical protein
MLESELLSLTNDFEKQSRDGGGRRGREMAGI